MTDSSLSWKERAEKAEAERDAAVEALKHTASSLMSMSVDDLPADDEERWWDLAKFASAYPLTYGLAHRVLSAPYAVPFLQRRERERAVIKAARAVVEQKDWDAQLPGTPVATLAAALSSLGDAQ